MGKRLHNLTPVIQEQICAFIRAGGYPHVAAEAAGIPPEVFDTWYQRGNQKHPPKQYQLFAQAIRQARAQARLTAEVATFQDNPLSWLKSGPGKETAASPGWTGIVKPLLTSNNQTINYFQSPDILNFLSLIRQVLTPTLSS